MAHRRLATRMTLLAAMALLAAGCRGTVQPNVAALPRILPPGPTLEQVIQAVNSNSDQITSLYCPRASLSGQGFPTLRTMVAFQKPNYFRLRAETSLTGAELDLGSNDQAFWFWMRRNQPPTLYFCRHDQFEHCPARQSLLFEPQWLIEALGMPRLDPRLPLEGPLQLPNDRLEIRTVENTPQGSRTKSTIIDAIHGCVVQQSVFDAQGRLIASAEAFQHRRDPLTNLILPAAVAIQSPAAQVSMRIDLGPVEVNRPRANATGMWLMPEYAGSAVVDLCGPQQPVQQPVQQAAPGAAPMAMPAAAMLPPGYGGQLGPR